jgi:hypothetical protein
MALAVEEVFLAIADWIFQNDALVVSGQKGVPLFAFGTFEVFVKLHTETVKALASTVHFVPEGTLSTTVFQRVQCVAVRMVRVLQTNVEVLGICLGVHSP